MPKIEWWWQRIKSVSLRIDQKNIPHLNREKSGNNMDRLIGTWGTRFISSVSEKENGFIRVFEYQKWYNSISPQSYTEM